MNKPLVNRRSFLHRTLATAAILPSPNTFSVLGQAQERQPASIDDHPAFTEYRYGHMVQDYYVRRFREIAEHRAETRRRITTPAQVWQLRDKLRLKIDQCYGERPEKTPLNPRITGTIQRDAYTIEKLIYESQPGYLVTANVYVPKGGPARHPAVLGTCGHSTNGKASVFYQEFCRNLARQGYVVLIYDPPSQGERLDYPDIEGQPRIRNGTHSHNVAGNQMSLVGRNFAAWEAWDGIRGVDYLLSRSDVDPAHIGVTGNSGGGTQTSHLNALEDRFTMAAPSCFVTRFLYNLENEEPTDAEQVVPGWIAAGLDMTDFFAAQIPRPTLLIGQKNDFFDVRGLQETFLELRRLYAIVGKEDRVQLHIGPGQHGYHQDGREAMYRFFNQHAGIKADATEPSQPAESDETLQVTPKGQVHILKSRTTASFTAEKARQLSKTRKPLSGMKLQKAVAQVLALPPRAAPPRYRGMRHRLVWNKPQLRDYGFVIETERNIRVMLHAIPQSGPQYFFPEGKKATIYVPHRSALKELILGQAKDIEKEPIRFAVDVRGVGQMTGRTHKDSGHDFFNYYRTDYMYANQGILLNEPYAGRRVHDLLRILDLFQSHGYDDLHLVGRGMGALTTTFASVLHPIVKRVTLYDTLLSYHELTQDPRYQWPRSSLVSGVLKEFDFPDCLLELHATKTLALIDPWDSRMKSANRHKFNSHLGALGLENLNVRWSA